MTKETLKQPQFNSDTEQTKIAASQKHIDSILARIKQDTEDADQLQVEIKQLDANIAEQNQQAIAPAIEANRESFELSQQLLHAAAKELADATSVYRTSKAGSGNQRKKDALNTLDAQVASPQQDLLRMQQAYATANGVPYNNLPASPIQVLDSDTASEVYKVTLNGAFGPNLTHTGYAKKATEEENDTTANLGFNLNGAQAFSTLPAQQQPNLIARQVVSHRIAELLGMTVIAPELFSRAEEGAVLGVTIEASGVALMKRTPDSDVYRHVDLSHSETQRGLADLQIVDAINGQMDRHLGNIFVDPATGKVTGIDNDMAHPKDSVYDDKATNALRQQFSTNADGRLVYHQTLIPQESAQRIIAMNRDELRQILQGDASDPERIDDVAIENTLKRFDAVKERSIALARQQQQRAEGGPIDVVNPPGQLVKANEWNEATYHEALQYGFTTVENADDSLDHSNYLLRAAYKYDESGHSDNPNVQLPPGV